jgi:transposase
MPRAFPREFREHVAAVARRREASFAQVAKDFGISETTVQNWVSKAEVDEGVKPGLCTSLQTVVADSLWLITRIRHTREIWFRVLKNPPKR